LKLSNGKGQTLLFFQNKNSFHFFMNRITTNFGRFNFDTLKQLLMKGKITFATLAFLCCSFFVNAQIKQKSVLLGGKLYYSNAITKLNDRTNSKSNSAIIILSVGQAIKQNSVLGVNLQFSPSTSYQFNDLNVQYKSQASGYGAGVFYRQYKSLAKDFYFFIEADANYFYLKQTVSDTSGFKLQNVSQSSVQLSLAPGISYKVFKNLHLEVAIPQLLSVQYGAAKNNLDRSNSQKQFAINTSLNSTSLNNLSVGFKLIF